MASFLCPGSKNILEKPVLKQRLSHWPVEAIALAYITDINICPAIWESLFPNMRRETKVAKENLGLLV